MDKKIYSQPHGLLDFFFEVFYNARAEEDVCNSRVTVKLVISGDRSKELDSNEERLLKYFSDNIVFGFYGEEALPSSGVRSFDIKTVSVPEFIFNLNHPHPDGNLITIYRLKEEMVSSHLPSRRSIIFGATYEHVWSVRLNKVIECATLIDPEKIVDTSPQVESVYLHAESIMMTSGEEGQPTLHIKLEKNAGEITFPFNFSRTKALTNYTLSAGLIKQIRNQL